MYLYAIHSAVITWTEAVPGHMYQALPTHVFAQFIYYNSTVLPSTVFDI